jgi:hypothetical protein
MNSVRLIVAAPLQRVIAALGAYLAFFLALFAQYPLQGAVPGNCDTLLVISLSNTYITKAAELLGLGAAGHAMYPVENILAYGESAPASALLFILPKLLLGLNDVYAYYVFITLVFTLTALGTFIFAGLFMTSTGARLFAGFSAACSNMMFSHIDDQVLFLYFIPLVTITVMVRAVEHSRPRWMLWGAALGGLQVYFSLYVFLFQTALLAGLWAYYHLRVAGIQKLGATAKAALCYALVAAPFFIFYILVSTRFNVVSVWDPEVIIRALSLNPSDVLKAVPGNLLYGRDHLQHWSALRHQNLIGFAVLAAALFAFCLRGRHRPMLGFMALAGVVLALGPDVAEGATALAPAPLHYFYQWIPALDYLRVPVRAYFLVVIAVSVLAGVTLQFLLGKSPKSGASALLLVLFFGVQIVENVPFPLRPVKLGPHLEAPAEYMAFFADKHDKLILDLPTGLGLRYDNFKHSVFHDPAAFIYREPGQPQLSALDERMVSVSDRDIYHYNRDLLYMNWQTQHKQNIVGGANGYFPVSRLIFERWALDLPDERALLWLREQGVDYIAYHQEMVLPGDRPLLYYFENSPHLKLVVDGERSKIFEFVD